MTQQINNTMRLDLILAGSSKIEIPAIDASIPATRKAIDSLYGIRETASDATRLHCLFSADTGIVCRLPSRGALRFKELSDVDDFIRNATAILDHLLAGAATIQGRGLYGYTIAATRSDIDARFKSRAPLLADHVRLLWLIYGVDAITTFDRDKNQILCMSATWRCASLSLAIGDTQRLDFLLRGVHRIEGWDENGAGGFSVDANAPAIVESFGRPKKGGTTLGLLLDGAAVIAGKDDNGKTVYSTKADRSSIDALMKGAKIPAEAEPTDTERLDKLLRGVSTITGVDGNGDGYTITASRNAIDNLQVDKAHVDSAPKPKRRRYDTPTTAENIHARISDWVSLPDGQGRELTDHLQLSTTAREIYAKLDVPGGELAFELGDARIERLLRIAGPDAEIHALDIKFPDLLGARRVIVLPLTEKLLDQLEPGNIFVIHRYSRLDFPRFIVKRSNDNARLYTCVPCKQGAKEQERVVTRHHALVLSVRMSRYDSIMALHEKVKQETSARSPVELAQQRLAKFMTSEVDGYDTGTTAENIQERVVRALSDTPRGLGLSNNACAVAKFLGALGIAPQFRSELGVKRLARLFKRNTAPPQAIRRLSAEHLGGQVIYYEHQLSIQDIRVGEMWVNVDQLYLVTEVGAGVVRLVQFVPVRQCDAPFDPDRDEVPIAEFLEDFRLVLSTQDKRWQEILELAKAARSTAEVTGRPGGACEPQKQPTSPHKLFALAWEYEPGKLLLVREEDEGGTRVALFNDFVSAAVGLVDKLQEAADAVGRRELTFGAAVKMFRSLHPHPVLVHADKSITDMELNPLG